MSLLARYFIGFPLVPLLAWGQVPQDTARAPHSTIRIRANVDSAFVHLDGTRVGRTPLVLDSVQAGTHLLRILPPDTLSWLFDPLSDTLRLDPGESKDLRYLLSYRLLVNSVPSGATVYCQDSVVGTTPILLTSEEVIRYQTLTLRKEGYEAFPLSISTLQGGSVMVPLERGMQERDTRNTLAIDDREGRNWTPVFLSGGGAILFGGLAAYSKIAADERDAAFRASGSPSAADERNRLDTTSAVATVAMELCLVYFVYKLLME